MFYLLYKMKTHQFWVFCWFFLHKFKDLINNGTFFLETSPTFQESAQEFIKCWKNVSNWRRRRRWNLESFPSNQEPKSRSPHEFFRNPSAQYFLWISQFFWVFLSTQYILQNLLLRHFSTTLFLKPFYSGTQEPWRLLLKETWGEISRPILDHFQNRET